MGSVCSMWQLGLCRRDSSAPLRCAQNDMRGRAGDGMLGLLYGMGYGVLDVMMSRRQRAVLCRRGLRLGKCMLSR